MYLHNTISNQHWSEVICPLKIAIINVSHIKTYMRRSFICLFQYSFQSPSPWLHPGGWSDPVPEVRHIRIHRRIISETFTTRFVHEWRCPDQFPLTTLVARQRTTTVAVASTSSIFGDTDVIGARTIDVLLALGAGPYIHIEFLQVVRWTPAVVSAPAGDITVTVSDEVFPLVAHGNGADVAIAGIGVLAQVDEADVIGVGRVWVVAGVAHNAWYLVSAWLSLSLRLDVVNSQSNGVRTGWWSNTVRRAHKPSTTDETGATDVIAAVLLQGTLPWIFARSGVTAAYNVGQLGAQGRHQNSSQYDQEFHDESLTWWSGDFVICSRFYAVSLSSKCITFHVTCFLSGRLYLMSTC